MLALSCQPPKTKNNNPYAELFRTSPATSISSYTPSPGWRNRIMPLSEIHKKYIIDLNKIDGFDETPSLPENFTYSRNTLASIKLMPEVEAILDKYILGIYLCENLGGTGVSGIVYRDNKPAGGFVILDSKVLDKNANDWITGKERSVFAKSNLQLNIEIENPEDNTIANSMRYILLHETGHVAAIVNNLLPDYRKDYRDFENHVFLKGVWPEENKSIYDAVFPLRNKIRFYTSKGLSLDNEWRNIYPVLERTGFPTLYSAMHPDEFFAEYFVSYIHTVIDRKKWELSIKDKDHILFKMSNGILKNKNSMQYGMIQNLFKN